MKKNHNSFHFFQPHSPPYASSVLFELYKSSQGYYIQLFYRNTSVENPQPLNIPSCGPKCTIEQFRKIYETVIPSRDFKEECKVSMLSMPYADVDFRVDGSKILNFTIMLITMGNFI